MKTSVTIFFFAPLFIVLSFQATKIKRIPKVEMSELALGKILFFEKSLSRDSTISCASCHKPEFAFADNQPLSEGIYGFKTKRNTPSAMNSASRDVFFWDGRAKSLEEQMIGPFTHPHEMDMTMKEILIRVNSNKKLNAYFKKIYKSPATEDNLTKAIGNFERSLETAKTPNDRWLHDLPNGLNEQQIKGREVFFGKGKCIQCHFTPDFTGDEFRNIGLFDGKKWVDSGRYHVTKQPKDIGKFKVPGLRNVAITAPYMHDGSFESLKEVLKFYNSPEKFIEIRNPNTDTLLVSPLGMTDEDLLNLEQFLIGLTDDQFVKK
jgi:cytochrome c peroxidase